MLKKRHHDQTYLLKLKHKCLYRPLKQSNLTELAKNT